MVPVGKLCATTILICIRRSCERNFNFTTPHCPKSFPNWACNINKCTENLITAVPTTAVLEGVSEAYIFMGLNTDLFAEKGGRGGLVLVLYRLINQMF